MANNVAIYSPQDVNVTLFGIFTLYGFVDGDFINIQKSADVFTATESMDGIVSRTRKPSTLYNMEVTLASTSDCNTILSKIRQFDEATGMGKFPILLRDASGSTVFFSPVCWISAIPDVSFGTDVTPRVWKFSCTNGDMSIGGNQGNYQGADGFLGQAAAVLPNILQNII